MTRLTSKLLTTTKTYAKDTGGNFAIMMGFLLFAFVGALACSIDMTNAFKTKSRLQDVTDVIALQAAKDKSLDTPAKLMESAQKYIETHYPGAYGARIVIQSITRDGDTVNVEATDNIDAYFAQIFGHDTLDVAVNSSATYAPRKLDLALVLDTTGSMKWKTSGPLNQTKLSALKTAANGLITKLESTNNRNLKVSVVPFAKYVNVGMSRRNAIWIDVEDDYTIGGTQVKWNGCVGSRAAPWHERVEYSNHTIPGIMQGLHSNPVEEACGAEIQPLTSDMETVKSTINAMTSEGWTYIPSGLSWGWRTLDTSEPLTEATYDPRNETDKVMVVMTDGRNTRSKSGLTHDVENGNDANNVTKKMCQNIKDSEIVVYTIAFELNDVPTKTMLRNCATKNSMFFDAKNSAQLNEAFQNIAESLGELRLTN